MPFQAEFLLGQVPPTKTILLTLLGAVFQIHTYSINPDPDPAKHLNPIYNI